MYQEVRITEYKFLFFTNSANIRTFQLYVTVKLIHTWQLHNEDTYIHTYPHTHTHICTYIQEHHTYFTHLLGVLAAMYHKFNIHSDCGYCLYHDICNDHSSTS